jgi:hypothetical protein
MNSGLIGFQFAAFYQIEYRLAGATAKAGSFDLAYKILRCFS